MTTPTRPIKRTHLQQADRQPVALRYDVTGPTVRRLPAEGHVQLLVVEVDLRPRQRPRVGVLADVGARVERGRALVVLTCV